MSLLHLQRLRDLMVLFQNASPNIHTNETQLLQMKTQYTTTDNLISRLCLCPLQEEVVVYAYLNFLKHFLVLEVWFFFLYEHPYLVHLALFAYGQYTLLLKEVKDKKVLHLFWC